MTDVRIVVNNEALNKLLRGPEGPVGDHLYRRGQRVQRNAKRNVNNPGRGRGGAKPKIRSGDLFHSIFTSQPAVLSGELSVVVGSDAEHGGVAYPLLLEKGGVARFRARRGPAAGKIVRQPYRYAWLVPALATEFGRRG